MKKLFLLLAAGYFVFQFPDIAFAQRDASANAPQEEGAAARYILPGERNAIRMEVNLWGEVGRPGTYVIPSDMDLVGLISSASGPTEFAKLKLVKIIRAYPQEGEPRIIDVDLREFLQTADASKLPGLNPGDTVFVPGGMRRNFASSLGLAATISSVLSAVALIYERLQRAGSY